MIRHSTATWTTPLGHPDGWTTLLHAGQKERTARMNVTTLVFLGLAVVWAIVLLPELLRKLAGSRHTDTIRSFNQQLSVLDRSGGRSTGRSNVIDLRSRANAPRPAAASARPVPPSVRKRRQEVLTVLGSAAVLTLLCTVAFGGPFLVLHIVADVLLVTYLVLLVQATNQAPAATRDARVGRAHWDDGSQQALRTATVGRATPTARRIAN
jgi:hypothetical protein